MADPPTGPSGGGGRGGGGNGDGHRRPSVIASQSKRPKPAFMDDDDDFMALPASGSGSQNRNESPSSSTSGRATPGLSNLLRSADINSNYQGGHDQQPLSETGSAENSGREFLAKLDKNFICGPRLIVRGEYIGRSDGTDYKLIVRRKTEGTYVDWGLHNMKTKKQILLVRGEMSYPYNLEQKNERRKTYGRYIKGGWSYEGWGYGYLNLNGLSDWFRKDPRVLHIDIYEALFYDEEVYHLYHVCGPKCKNADKAVGIKCTEGDCGLRIHSVVFTSFTTCSEDHDLRPTSYSKKEEVQSVFMSLVQFFDGQFKVVVHRDPRIRRYDKEVMWMSPAPNLCFNDTVAGVDRKMLEKA